LRDIGRGVEMYITLDIQEMIDEFVPALFDVTWPRDRFIVVLK
jgi:hypothetical protein